MPDLSHALSGEVKGLRIGVPRAFVGDGIDRPTLDAFESALRVLTARGATEDRVAGLDGGADDYMVKPFEFAELRARLRSLTRRPAGERPVAVEVGGLRLDPVARSVTRAGTPVELSRLEFSLLEALLRNPGRVMSRFDLLEKVWDNSYENRSNVVDVYIRYLRQKIDLPFLSLIHI